MVRLSLISLRTSVYNSINLSNTVEHPRKHILLGTHIYDDIQLLKKLLSCFEFVGTLLWLACILLQSGDIHPNLGSSISESSLHTDTSSSSPTYNTSATNHLSFVHYNVQSLVHKLDILSTGLQEFDIIAFTETWLNDSILSSDLMFNGFHLPIRKDRPLDPHGGVIIYVNENIAFKRRSDLEFNHIECIWIEVTPNKNKSILFGVFYRPPSADSAYMKAIEDSFGLACDSCVNDVIITGDFNLNLLSPASSTKIENLCQQFNLTQLIHEPTHHTEQTSSIID